MHRRDGLLERVNMVIGVKRHSSAVSIEFDPKARVAYIRLKPGKIARTVEKSDHFLLDLSSRGDLLGIEILNPHQVSRGDFKSLFSQIARKYKNANARHIHPEFVPQVFAA
jgi:uncharacterized protein YuzE